MPTVRMVAVTTWLVLSVTCVLGRSRSLTRLWSIGNWARNCLRRVIHVELLVNSLRNGLYFSTQFLFNLVQVKAIIPIYEIDRQTQVSKATRSANSVEISLGILRKIEIDHDIHGLNVNTSSQ